MEWAIQPPAIQPPAIVPPATVPLAILPLAIYQIQLACDTDHVEFDASALLSLSFSLSLSDLLQRSSTMRKSIDQSQMIHLLVATAVKRQ